MAQYVRRDFFLFNNVKGQGRKVKMGHCVAFSMVINN